MISCVQRAQERRRTLEQLEAVGVRPSVAESPCNPAGGPQNRAAALEALRFAEGNDCLFLEDDIDVNPHLFPAFLEMARNQGEVVTFTVFRKALYPDGVWSDPTPRLVPLVNWRQRRGFYGTQCVYLPRSIVHKALSRFTDFVKPDGSPLDECHGFDFWLKDNADQILMAFPNPVQHRAPRKMRPGRESKVGADSPHRSPSFDLGVQHAAP